VTDNELTYETKKAVRKVTKVEGNKGVRNVPDTLFLTLFLTRPLK
jgi:hypothetical protein